MADTREKLIELLCDVIETDGCSGHCDFPPCYLVKACADHLIANGVTIQKWIPVSERLPEDICPVLVALEGLPIAFHGWYQDEEWWPVGAGSRPFIKKVTHWIPMPMPDPPKGE